MDTVLPPGAAAPDPLARERARLLWIRAQMEMLRMDAISRFAEFLAAWYPQRARELVRAEPHVAERLGADGLRALEAEVALLSARVAEKTAAVLGDAEHWWHLREPFPDTRWANSGETRPDTYRFRHNDAPPPLWGPLHRLLEELGDVFHAAGFLRASDGRRAAAPFAMSWPPEIKKPLAEYADRGNAALKLHKESEFARYCIENPYWWK